MLVRLPIDLIKSALTLEEPIVTSSRKETMRESGITRNRMPRNR